MKKVNFNALQNFEVPESWIENAINAKPKKKLFHLNPLHLSTAACLVIAVSNSIFSPLNLNCNFTPLTGSIVEEAIVGGADNSSTFTYPKDEELLTQNEIKTTFLAETTKSTEKPNATGVTEQNEEIYEQVINSEEQDNESSESENHSPVRAEESEQDEQSNNTKKPESIIKPQNPTAPIEEQKSSEQESNMSEEPESTVPTKEYTITKKWTRQILYYSGAGDGGSISGDDNNPDTPGKVESFEELSFFINEISVKVSGDIWKRNCKKIECIINGADENTEGIKGTLDFVFYNTTENVLSFKPSTESINIPCGKYNISFNYYQYDWETDYKLIEELPATTFEKTSLENDETIIFQL
ncbi:MAG: hypothetical protein U0L58_03365 [Ruminococcus sp.]|nr:hypothetical protein [Ruminococcus sp.]